MNSIAGASALVVGGAGFVGRNVVAELLDQGARSVLVVDNFLSSDPSPVLDRPGVSVIDGSIASDAVLTAIDDEFDLAFHLATFHGNQNSIADPFADHANNTVTSLKLFDHLKSFSRLRAVVYSSAGCTVAEKTFAEPRATTEDDPVSLKLDSPYQISKIVGEMYANFYVARHGLPVIITRFQNVYGPGEVLGSGPWRGTPETIWRNVVPTFVYRALTGMPLTVHGDGQMTRDFIFVEDVARGLLLAAVQGKAGGVYNLASGVETSILDLAHIVAREVEPEAMVELIPGRPWDRSGRRFGSTVKSSEELGFVASMELVDGLRSTVRWSQENLEMIRASIARHRDQAEPMATASAVGGSRSPAH